MDKLSIIKIGGNVIDDEQKLSSFLKSFSSIETKKILVHGGGKLATRLAQQLNVPQQIIEGRRITDSETLKIVTMVYAGIINKNIVAKLQSYGCNALGLCGTDGNLILANKRAEGSDDYGFVGDVDVVNTNVLQNLVNQTISPVIAPITHDGKGQLLNTNADTIAQEIAKAMSKLYDVELIYTFEKSGVLLNADDETSVIDYITPSVYADLKTTNKISDGMIPKMENAFVALNSGVKKVIIGDANKLSQLASGKSGTTIINEH